MLVDDRGAVGASVAEVVDAMEADLDVLVASVEDRVLESMQPMNGESPAALRETLHRGVSAAVRDALARLRSHVALPRELPPDLIALARLYAGSRLELDGRLADAALACQEAFWERFYVLAERTLADPGRRWDTIKAARARLRGNPARVTELFRKACERELACDSDIEDSRLQAVLRTLDGHWVDPEELGYDLSRHHVAVVADAPWSLDAMARRTKRQLLRVQAPEGGIWGWLGGQARMSDGDLDALLASDPSDTRVAFGEPAEGVAGFAASHRQAVEAMSIALATNQRAVRFADCRVLIAVLRDDGLAQGFIGRELGELDRPNERMRRLRATLRTYLENSQSISATAALLRRDHKTIERQLRSAEHLLHHPLSDRSDEVLIALRVAEILRHRDYSPTLAPRSRPHLLMSRSRCGGRRIAAAG